MRLLISIVLAFVVWGFVQWETDPDRSRTFFSIEIEQENLDPALQRTSPLPTVNVTARGPRSVILSLDATDVEAILDLKNVTEPGTTEQKITVPSIDGVREIETTPSSIDVTVERIVTEEFEIELEQPLPSPPNISNIELSTNTVVLTGTQSQMDRVDKVVVNLDLSGRTDTFGVDVSAVPVDSGGVEVEGITVSPDVIHIDILFEVQTRMIPVSVICRCITENGIELTNPESASSIPSEVQIVGPASLVADVGVIETEPVDISTIQESSFIYAVPLDESNLPDGVTLGVSSVDVWVEVAPEEVVFEDIPITVVNLEPGMRAVLSETTATFTITGPAEVLGTLESPPVPIVDANGLTTSTSRAAVQVILTPGLSFLDVTPSEVQLTIIRVQPAETLSLSTASPVRRD